MHLRRLKDVSKKTSLLRCFWEVFEMSLSMEICLRHLKDISCWLGYYIKEILYINTNSKGNQSLKRYKQIYIFTCLWSWCWFSSVLWTHSLKVIQQLFCRDVKLINVLWFFFSTSLTIIVWCIKSQTHLFIYLPSIVSFFQTPPSGCDL